MNATSISERRNGFKAAIPLIVGYVPLSVAFGMMAGNSGLSILEVLLMSTLVYSGAGQFMILSLMGAGAGVPEILFTTALLNSRMFLMATSFVNTVKQSLGKWKLFTAMTITDETFSVIIFRYGEAKREFIVSLNAVAITSWISGSIIGFYFGNILPENIKSGLNLTLYAMFASMLMPQLKKSFKLTFTVLLSGAINALVTYTKVLPNGWGVILGILLGSGFAAFFFRDGDVSGDKNRSDEDINSELYDNNTINNRIDDSVRGDENE